MAGDGGDWTRHALDVLDASVQRAGGARRAIVEVLGAEGGCLTADEVAERLRERGRPVGMASVYRALTLLAELGLVQPVPIGQGPVRYDLVAPSGGHHHHHLVCDRCGRLAPFMDGELEAAIERAGARLPYRVDWHDLTFRGLCPTCSRAPRRG
jgi:Fur family transcriptional regulator, ferric uptake regulator